MSVAIELEHSSSAFAIPSERVSEEEGVRPLFRIHAFTITQAYR